MRTINVIEVVDNNVIGMTSFGVFEEQLSNDIAKEAENHFAKLAKENGAEDIDMDVYLENGAFSENGYTVNLVWSEISE